VSPSPNYDLGTAHGQIVIDYDNKGTAQASKDFTSLGKEADSLRGHFDGLGSTLADFGRNFGSISQNFGRNFSIFAGGSAILGSLVLSAKNLGGSLLGLRGGISVLSALRTVIGGVPKSIQGFPNVLKQIVLLSSAVSLLGGGLKILEALSSRFALLGKAIPILQSVQEKLGLFGRPIKDIARLVLTIGTFITVGRDMVTLVQVIAKVSAAIALLTGGVHLIGGLVVAVEQLSGALLLLPAIGVAAGVVVGTLILGFQGMGAALKTANTPAQLKAQQKALDGLAPSARDFVTQVTAMKPAFKNLQLGVQQQLFEGLGTAVRNVGSIYIPIMRTGLQNVAGDLNLVGHQTALFLSFPDVAKDWVKVLANIHTTLNNLIPAWDAFLSVMDDVVTVGSGFLPHLADVIGNAAAKFASFIDDARQSGQLAGWIQTGIDAFRLLGQIIVNVFSILNSVFSAFNATGSGFLNTLANLTGVVATFFKTAQGSQALQSLGQIFNQIGRVVGGVLLAALQALGPIVIALLPLIRDLATDFGGSLIVAINILGPILLGVANTLNALAPIISPFAGSLFALGVVALGVGAAFRAIWSICSILILGIKVLQGVVIVFRSVILTLQVALWLTDAAALPLIATIGLFALAFLAIAAVVAAVVIIVIKYWKQISSFLLGVWHAIVNFATAIWGPVAGFFEGIWNSVSGFFTDVWNSIWGKTVSVWNSILNFFSGLASSVGGFFSDIGSAIAGAFTSIIHWFESLPGLTYRALIALPGIVIDILKWTFTRGLYYVEQGIEWIIAACIAFPIDAAIGFYKFSDMMGKILIAAFDNAVHATVGFITDVVNWFRQLPENVALTLLQWWNDLSIWWTNLNASVELWVGTVINNVVSWFQSLPLRIGLWLVNLWTSLSTWWINLNNSSQIWVGNLINGIVNWFQNLPSRIAVWFTVMWNNFSNWWTNLNSSSQVWIGNVINGAVAWFRSLPGKIVSALGDAGKWLIGIGKAILEGLLNGLKAAWNAVTGFVGGIADKIKALKGPLPYDRQLLIPAGQAIMGGLHQSIIGALPAILDTVRGIAPQIQDAMGSASATVGLGLGVTTVAATSAAALTAANGTVGGAASGASATAQQAAGQQRIINVENLNIQGNLDPTNPVAWRQTMKNLRDGLRDLDRSGATT